MGGQGNQRAAQELNGEIASIDLLFGAAHLSTALVEHQSLEKVWINVASKRIAQLTDSDVTYQALAELDVDLEKYSRMCSDWRPRYYGDKNNFPVTSEKANMVHLRKAVEDKMYAILMSGNSSIADQIGAISIYRDVVRFFNQYIIRNGGASTNALVRAGLYDNYKKLNELAKERDR